METDSNGDSWKIWRLHIIEELKRISNNQKVLESKLSDFLLTSSIDISKLKIYAAVTGALAGGIMSLLAREIIRRW